MADELRSYRLKRLSGEWEWNGLEIKRSSPEAEGPRQGLLKAQQWRETMRSPSSYCRRFSGLFASILLLQR